MVLAIAVGAGWVMVGYVGVVYVAGFVLRALASGVTLVPRAIVWLFLAAQDGADWWAIAGRAGAALGATLVSSQVMWWLVGVELLGVAALAGLHAMLRAEMRSRNAEEVKK